MDEPHVCDTKQIYLQLDNRRFHPRNQWQRKDEQDT